MSDNDAPINADTGQPATAENPNPMSADAPAQETDWKAEARKWESRAKENRTAAEELQQLKDAEKSELQRATEAAEAAQRELAASKSEAARLRIAAKHGIGEDHLDLLTGANEDELEAKAEKLAKLITTPTTQEPARKGAWAPFDPDEGKSPKSLPGNPADRFASALDDAGF